MPESENKRIFCPTFRPNREEFSRPFCEYVQDICRKNPEIAMFKVVPPEDWIARRSEMPSLDDIRIETPIKQHVFGTGGVFRSILEEQRSLTVADYKKLASRMQKTPPKGHRQDELLERAFWSSVTINPPLYGADNPTSLFDSVSEYGWNLNHLQDLLKKHDVAPIPGVTTPMVYFGMWKSFFSWHVEDVDLYSVNYLHFGEPKVWYCVSPKDRLKFEAMAKSLFPELHSICPAFLRHKDILVSPKKLRSHQIQYVQAKQEAGEFIVLNAGAYHSGFNLGFNCAEAVNFATEDWLATGKDATRCTCSALPDHVTLDMKIFSKGTRASQRLKAALKKVNMGAKTHSPKAGSESESSQSVSSSDDESAGSGDEASGRDITPSETSIKEEGHRRGQEQLKTMVPRKRQQKSKSLNELSQASPKPPRQQYLKGDQKVKPNLTQALAGNVKRVAKRRRLENPGVLAAATLIPRYGSKGHASTALAKLDAARGHKSRRLAGQPPGQIPQAKRQRGSKDFKDIVNSDAVLAPNPEASNSSSMGRAYEWVRALVGRIPPSSAKCNSQDLHDPVLDNDGAYAVVKEDIQSKERYFYLVQKLKRKARRKHNVVVRWLREEADELFRPAFETWEEAETALRPVKLSTQGPGDSSRPCQFRLLTPRSSILKTKLASA